MLSSSNNKDKDCQMQLDFFGEPVTFLGLSQHNNNSKKDADHTDNAMAAMDGFLLAVVSKGMSCRGGGDEAGLEAKSNHAAALSWAEALRHAAVWNPTPTPTTTNDTEPGDTNNGDQNKKTKKTLQKSAPMLAVVAVAPVLAQTGVAYVKHLDTLLQQAKPGAPGLDTVQMMDMAASAASKRNDALLNPREQMHLKALRHLLVDEHASALAILLRLLRSCPGDLLALSLVMDLAQTLGDKKAALQAAGTVVSYWHERRGGFVRPAIPGHAMTCAMVALGFAVGGGHVAEAEPMAEGAMKQGRKLSGALATWAQAYIYDINGRVSEGISALANGDGINNYEGAGFLFFESRLGGYGARFSLDREERGRGKSAALRLYEANFERVLEYSGFGQRQPWSQPLQRAPISWLERKFIGEGSSSSSSSDSSTIFSRLFGQKKDKEEKPNDADDFEVMVKEGHTPSRKVDGWEPSLEDVLTWIPPTPQLLTEATLLLFRFTMNGTISARNVRWDSVRNAWEVAFDIQRKHTGSTASLSKFCPLASIASSLLIPPSETGGDSIAGGGLARGLHNLGTLLNLGQVSTEAESSRAVREVVAKNDPSFWLPVNQDDEEIVKQWKQIVRDLTSALDGYDYAQLDDDNDDHSFFVDYSLRYEAWDFDARPVLEHAIVYAACKAGDVESLSIARSICSKGVTLRANSPEEWWRYSIVLGLLGDVVASEDALNNSINVGAGQGARG
jgi:hypothetical protein